MYHRNPPCRLLFYSNPDYTLRFFHFTPRMEEFHHHADLLWLSTSSVPPRFCMLREIRTCITLAQSHDTHRLSESKTVSAITEWTPWNHNHIPYHYFIWNHRTRAHSRTLGKSSTRRLHILEITKWVNCFFLIFTECSYIMELWNIATNLHGLLYSYMFFRRSLRLHASSLVWKLLKALTMRSFTAETSGKCTSVASNAAFIRYETLVPFIAHGSYHIECYIILTKSGLSNYIL